MNYLKSNLIGIVIGVVVSAPIIAFATDSAFSIKDVENKINKMESAGTVTKAEPYAKEASVYIEYLKLEEIQKQTKIIKGIENELKKLNK